MFRLQGLLTDELPNRPVVASEKLIGDLAGNAFAATCILSSTMALLAALQPVKNGPDNLDSEEEELQKIGRAFKAVSALSDSFC